MLPLVEFPQIVQHYAPWFEAVFSAEALVQFQRYLSGLIISENKTVDGINRLFVIEELALLQSTFLLIEHTVHCNWRQKYQSPESKFAHILRMV